MKQANTKNDRHKTKTQSSVAAHPDPSIKPICETDSEKKETTPQEMTKYIKVRCRQCLGFYNVRYSADLKILAKRLDFSVCHCGYIRNPKMYMPFFNDKHCYGCGLPKPICEKFVGDYCSICYLHDVYYQKDHKYIKREVSLRGEIVILKLNEETKLTSERDGGGEHAPVDDVLHLQAPEDSPDSEVSGPLQQQDGAAAAYPL